MRTEAEILAELNEALATYRTEVDALEPDEIADHNRRVRLLRQELSDCIAHGASNCPKCGKPPLGMKRQDDKYELYEIGCTVCPPETVEKDGVIQRSSYSAQGPTPERAVRRWNDRQFITDYRSA